jgi:hypothetical protein
LLVAFSLAIAQFGTVTVASDPPSARVVTHQLLSARVMKGSEIPHGPMVYLVTPAGHLFRTLGQQPILDEDGTKLGLLVSYVGDTRDLATAAARNTELMNALSLDAQVMGVTAVLIQDRIGFDPRKAFNTSLTLDTSYSLRDGGWAELPKPPRRLAAVSDLLLKEVSVEGIDQPGFPFDREALANAEHVAHRWVLAADAVDFDRMRQEMSETESAKLMTAAWKLEVAHFAQVRRGAPRRELYRLQARADDGGTTARVMYEVDLGVPGRRALDHVALRKELGRWRVTGYGFYYPKEADRSAPKGGTEGH